MPKSMKPMRLPGHDQHVAGMRIGVGTRPPINAICRKASVHSGRAGPCRSPPRRGHGRWADAVHEFLHEHALGGPFPVDLGHHDVVAIGEDRRDGLAVACFVDEIRARRRGRWPDAASAPGAGSGRIPATRPPRCGWRDPSGAGPLLDDLAQARTQAPSPRPPRRSGGGRGRPARWTRRRRRGVELGEDLRGGGRRDPPRVGPMRSHGIGETWLWSFSSSSVHSGVRRSGRLARIWPSFTKVGPRVSMARRTRWGCDRRVMSTCGVRRLASRATCARPRRSTTFVTPKPMRTDAISRGAAGPVRRRRRFSACARGARGGGEAVRSVRPDGG